MNMTTTDEIVIKAQVLTEDSCQFIVDRPLMNGSRYFDSHDAAAASPLAEKIFAIKNVDGVLISNNIVKVSKLGYDQWMTIAKKVGVLIREQLQSGEPIINESAMNAPIDEQDIRKKMIDLLQSQINPNVSSHGGFVALMDVKNNDVYLQLGGGCQGCGMATVTLRSGIEKMIRANIPEVGAVIDVTDHDNGMSPYYK